MNHGVRRRQIYVGDYVRLNEDYLQNWKVESRVRLKELRETIFMVIESNRCWNWIYGIGGGGMLVTLKPFVGPMLRENLIISRGEPSLEIVAPSIVDQALQRSMKEREDLDDIGTI